MKRYCMVLNGKEKISTLFRFCTVGVGNTLVDFVMFFFLTSMGIPYLFAQVCSYTAGMMNSYLWNRFWTFRVKQKATMQELFRFVVINLFSLGTTFFVLYMFQQKWEGPLFISKVIATVAGVIVNFIGSRFFVFVNKGSERATREN
jgi:putative flippase GtrA